jgi:hypothetical protein
MSPWKLHRAARWAERTTATAVTPASHRLLPKTTFVALVFRSLRWSCSGPDLAQIRPHCRAC